MPRDGIPQPGVRPVSRSLPGGELLAGRASGRRGEGGDDAMGAGRGEVVGTARKGVGDPDDLASRVGDDLDVHAVAAVLAGVVGASVADPVALGERAVHPGQVLRFPDSGHQPYLQDLTGFNKAIGHFLDSFAEGPKAFLHRRHLDDQGAAITTRPDRHSSAVVPRHDVQLPGLGLPRKAVPYRTTTVTFQDPLH